MTTFGISCYQPAQLQQAYDLGPLFSQGFNGTGSTIVIVDPFGSPTISNDLKVFDQTFGLPDPPSFQVIAPAGPIPPYPSDPAGPVDRAIWAGETSLDVEWSHVIAPGANILLVETPISETEGVAGFPEIVEAENYVVDHNLGDVISQSFGAGEQTFPGAQSILDLRSAFVNAQLHGVTVLAAAGDEGSSEGNADGSCCSASPITAWPSSDPLVTSVGGTHLDLDGTGNRLTPDTVWNDFPLFGTGSGAGGGGQSTVFPRPAFQSGVSAIVGAARGTPDISMNASLDGAVGIYHSYCDYLQDDPTTGVPPLCGGQWQLGDGTSESTPLFAGIVAIADQAAGHRLGWLDPTLYANAGDGLDGGIVDVTSGNNGYVFCTANCGAPNEVDTTVPGFGAGPGYDMASGLGTIDAAKFVAALAARPTTTIAFASPPIATPGAPVTMSAVVATAGPGSNSPTGTVAFHLDGQTTPVATVALTGGHASFKLAAPAAGAHAVTAVYNGASGFTASSSPPAHLLVIGARRG
jgi:subtilase family serine protease